MEAEISASNAFSVQMLPWINGTEYGPPVTSTTGGNSSSNVDAGENEDAGNGKSSSKPITTGDKAGAGILTVIFVGGLVGMATFMFLGA
jgi:mannan endo-1,6-alpha-mannosidase